MNRIFWIISLVAALILANCGEDPRSPTAFFFYQKVDVPPSTLIESEPVKITQNQYQPDIVVENGEYKINDGEWTSQTSRIPENSILRVRHFSANTYGTDNVTKIHIFDKTSNFITTTTTDTTEQPAAEGTVLTATAMCKNNSISYAQFCSDACVNHGSVAQWLTPDCP